MATFTSSLPNDLLEMLDEHAKKLEIPKNKLIEKALRLYLEHLKRAAYVNSYSQTKEDKDMVNLAEEGMAEYFKQIEDETR
ncbi:ribbon-helix-helix domain-containing protein [Belliella sp. R4-6]|uniref:Ribbon-helix-helix domain-containing protein n=1 Tax=Belliella alkalica TaxID=1730871 RepID=A0ABS9VA85_9BACT|nr:ribbon-helix-helix domain-containing protein [Belliella alkalica]MCH7412823.1 ribbon-helix-helix domain-containing protein [Belliella alkalica]